MSDETTANNFIDEAAARRAAEQIVEFTFDEYPDNDMKRGQLITHVAEIISTELKTSDSGKVEK